LCILAELRVEQGRIDDAAALVEAHADEPVVAGAMARVHLCRGDADAAAALLRRAVREMRGDSARAEPFTGLLVEAELARGDYEAAGAAADGLHDGHALLAHGRIASALEDWPAACEALATAAMSADAARRPALAAAIRVELAEALAASGDSAAAAADGRIALRAFEGLGSAMGADRARAVLRSVGVREASGGRSDLSSVGLSKREIEVLELVRLGLSNAEIGRRLYISAKTVEHHVGHILTKLGVRSRGEAAAVANKGFG
jgi:DNA-binding CsgD family transcriptional regulator